MPSYSSEELKQRRQNREQSDWERIASMKDSEINFSDIPELDEKAFNLAQVIGKPAKVKITINLDDDVLTWLKSKDKRYQTRINKILRQVMELETIRTNKELL
jgi:uncharacterized protein (DUF4415 family)